MRSYGVSNSAAWIRMYEIAFKVSLSLGMWKKDHL